MSSVVTFITGQMYVAQAILHPLDYHHNSGMMMSRLRSTASGGPSLDISSTVLYLYQAT
jgi:hypothetical protein